MGTRPYTLLLRYISPHGHSIGGGAGGGEGGEDGGVQEGGAAGRGEGGAEGEWAAAVVVPPGALVEVSWSGVCLYECVCVCVCVCAW